MINNNFIQFINEYRYLQMVLSLQINNVNYQHILTLLSFNLILLYICILYTYE